MSRKGGQERRSEALLRWPLRWSKGQEPRKAGSLEQPGEAKTHILSWKVQKERSPVDTAMSAQGDQVTCLRPPCSR